MLQVYVSCFSTRLRVHHQSHVRYPTDIQFLAIFLLIYSNCINCFNYSMLQIINISLVAWGLAGGFLPYLRLKFRCAWISDFVSNINQETHWAFSCGVLIFVNSTFATKFKNILLNQ